MGLRTWIVDRPVHDFHTIRHYGDPRVSRLEKDYVPRRSQSVPAVVSAFAQEWEGREMVYARASLLKEEKADEVVRFVDYWREVGGKLPKELVFDGHMTTHAGLAQLDRQGIKFLTLRERRSREVERIRSLPEDRWSWRSRIGRIGTRRSWTSGWRSPTIRGGSDRWPR